MIHLVTDSTSDLTAADAAAVGAHVVPLTVMFGEEQFRDGIDLSADAFFDRLPGTQVQPTTSQPSPEAFAAVYRDLLKDPSDSVVSVHISSQLSGTLQSATLAAQEFGGRVRCVDSESVSGGIGVIVRALSRAVRSGMSLDDVVAEAETLRSRTHVCFLLETLTYLHRGGRIGGARAFVGGVLGVKPLLELRHGRVEPHSRVRSFSKGLDALAALVGAGKPIADAEVIWSTTPDLARDYASRLEKELGVPVRCSQLGPVVGTYAGPGLIGVGFLEKR